MPRHPPPTHRYSQEPRAGAVVWQPKVTFTAQRDALRCFTSSHVAMETVGAILVCVLRSHEEVIRKNPSPLNGADFYRCHPNNPLTTFCYPCKSLPTNTAKNKISLSQIRPTIPHPQKVRTRFAADTMRPSTAPRAPLRPAGHPPPGPRPFAPSTPGAAPRAMLAPRPPLTQPPSGPRLVSQPPSRPRPRDFKKRKNRDNPREGRD